MNAGNSENQPDFNLQRDRGESVKTKPRRELITVEAPVESKHRRNSEKRRVKKRLIHSDGESENDDKYKVS
jgi:hypothetical protein